MVIAHTVERYPCLRIKELEGWKCRLNLYGEQSYMAGNGNSTRNLESNGKQLKCLSRGVTWTEWALGRGIQLAYLGWIERVWRQQGQEDYHLEYGDEARDRIGDEGSKERVKCIGIFLKN